MFCADRLQFLIYPRDKSAILGHSNLHTTLCETQTFGYKVS